MEGRAPLQLLPSCSQGANRVPGPPHRNSELALLKCSSILASVALGMDLAELMGEGLSAPQGPPSSLTLLSLSSLSDCNSTKSLLPSDSDEVPVYEAPCLPEPQSPSPFSHHNPLVDLTVESFKKDPHQSITPTHISAPQALSLGHRRTPSDGVICHAGQGLLQAAENQGELWALGPGLCKPPPCLPLPLERTQSIPGFGRDHGHSWRISPMDPH